MRKRSLSQFVFFWNEIGKAEKKQEKFSVITFNKSADIRKNDPRPGIEKVKRKYFPKEIGKWRMVIVYKKGFGKPSEMEIEQYDEFCDEIIK